MNAMSHSGSLSLVTSTPTREQRQIVAKVDAPKRLKAKTTAELAALLSAILGRAFIYLYSISARQEGEL
jgi:hypothetical protein